MAARVREARALRRRTWEVAHLPAFVLAVEPGHPVYRAAYEGFWLPDEAAPQEQSHAASEDEEGAGNAFVAPRAAAALARFGEKAGLARLAHAAERAPTVCLRAEALRWLGELAPEAHLARLEAALVDDAASYADYDTPAQEEAAYVLARLATPPAMTALVRGYLAAKSNPAWDALDTYFTRLVVDPRGPPPEAFATTWRARVRVARRPVGGPPLEVVLDASGGGP